MSRIVCRFSAIAFAVSLAACSHVPVSTMWALRNFDAASVDPTVLRAAVRLPETFEPQKGGVTLKIGWWRDGEEKAKHEMSFALKETTAPEDVAPLAGETKAGTRIYAYRVDPTDYAAIRARQREFLEEKARNPGKTHGSFGVGAEACRRGAFPEGPLLTTTFLRTQPAGDYLTVLRNADMREAATKEKPLDELVPLCV
ncbi:hypothetical protein [Methylocystis sp. B8]|uniref:hypothetical protein n=1 Tax=Methylocystis sp. B8 TaxID=544938 RepID=UPI0010FE3574|nr:hypothetical protein [Methylocystis sp. B8]TLG79281.1 hypothetical protein FEV16_04570 [Methylocystis sp. B8]